MKIITSIVRLIVGGLFIFSGLIKNNDPKGTAIKFNEYFDVFSQDVKSKQDSLIITFTDNEGYSATESFVLTTNDSVIDLMANQSKPEKEEIETSENDSAQYSDSAWHSTFYGIVKGNNFFENEYLLDSTPHTIHLLARLSNDSILLDKKIQLTPNTKHELQIPLDVSPYIKAESMWVGFFQGLKDYALFLAILMCVLEVGLGFAILIGWKPKITLWLTLALIVFFSILTFYSAYYNKVTDCGCFGDFIKLKPWTSFNKDLILLILILFLIWRRNHIIPIFSKLFSWNAVILVTLGSYLFAWYCNKYLPVWDFLPYKEGNNIKQIMTAPPGQRQTDSMQMVFIYEKDGLQKTFSMSNIPSSAEGWKFVDRKDSIIIPAWKSPIHDFSFSKREDSEVDLKDSILNGTNFQLVFIAPTLEKSDIKAWKEIKELAAAARKEGINVYGATSSSLSYADIFANENQLPFKFYNGDQTLLKTIARSNPLTILFYKATVIKKWSCERVPNYKKIKKLISKNQ